MRFEVVSFLSDFGLHDVFVGVCHGVLARTAPHARVIDLTHAASPGDVRQGARLLARAVPYLPPSVHLAVVDPGVGSQRRGVVISAARGDQLVGPDNGLLVPAAEALGGITAAHELRASEYRLQPLSTTFHGRDVFSPAGGALASGLEPARLGPPVADLVTLNFQPPRIQQDGPLLLAEVALIDRFGNLQLAAPADALAEIGVRVGDRVEVSLGKRRVTAPVVTTFADLSPGELGLYVDSDWQLALTVNGGSAAATLQIDRGGVVSVRPDMEHSPDRRRAEAP